MVLVLLSAAIQALQAAALLLSQRRLTTAVAAKLGLH